MYSIKLSEGICFITLEKKKKTSKISRTPESDNIENLQIILIQHFLWETETEAYGTQMEGFEMFIE